MVGVYMYKTHKKGRIGRVAQEGGTGRVAQEGAPSLWEYFKHQSLLTSIL